MRDEVEILGSPLGMYSLLRVEVEKETGDKYNYIISVLKDDGSLDKEKLKTIVSTVANMGANGLRDFFWIHSQKALDTISPFNGALQFNRRYFDIQEKIAEVCNQYNMRYYLSIFDHCGTKGDVSEWNPWRPFNDFFYGEDAKAHRHAFIDKVLEAFEGLDTGIELCNEPKERQAKFLTDTFLYLHQKGFDMNKVILGIDYYKKEQAGSPYKKDYGDFRDAVAAELNQHELEWENKLKSVCISPVHNATIERIDNLWEGGEEEAVAGGSRRVLYSMDGVRENKNEIKKCRPDKNMMHQIARKVFDKKTKARKKGKLLFEVVYGKTDFAARDPLDSLKGVSEAFKETSDDNKHPVNWGKPIYEGGDNGGDDNGGDVDPSRLHKIQVKHGYRGILGRDTDPDGLRDYTDFLAGGGTVLEFCRKLTASDEYRDNRANLPAKDLATDFYNGILEREPDPGGLRDTITDIQNGLSAERAAGMLQSDEFKNKFG